MTRKRHGTHHQSAPLPAAPYPDDRRLDAVCQQVRSNIRCQPGFWAAAVPCCRYPVRSAWVRRFLDNVRTESFPCSAHRQGFGNRHFQTPHPRMPGDPDWVYAPIYFPYTPGYPPFADPYRSIKCSNLHPPFLSIFFVPMDNLII